MKTYYSEFTFDNLVNGPLNFIKVIWNGEVVYDDDYATAEILELVENTLKNKVIYEAKITIVQFHHCIIEIFGQDLTSDERQRIIEKSAEVENRNYNVR